MPAILGKKLGMSQIFTEDGDRVPVTVIEAGPCTIVQVKTQERDGYTALQIGFGDVKERRVNKPLAGHFKKAGVAPVRHLAEIRCDLDEAAGWVKAPEKAEKKGKSKKAKAKAKEAEAKQEEVVEAAEEAAEAEAGEAAGAAPEPEAAETEAAEAAGEGEAAEAEAVEAPEAEAAVEEEAAAEVEVEAEAPSQGAVVGGRITVDAFAAGQQVKVSGVSKGKGFAGVIKRHNFAGGPGSHGAHFHRAPGSVGASAYPSRVFKGLRLPGHMGNARTTQRGLTVVSTDPDNNLLFIRGSVPGSSNSIIFIQTD